MDKDKFESKAVELMDKNKNQSMPKEFKKYLQNLPLTVTKKDGLSSQTMNIYGGGKHSLITVTQRYETKKESDNVIKNEAFIRMMDSLPPQVKTLFKYNGYWENAKKTNNYKFVSRLELVRGDDGYVLYARFD